MKIEQLKDLVNKKPTFIRSRKVTELPDGVTQRDTYLLATSVKDGVHSDGYHDWKYVEVQYAVMVELTYFKAKDWDAAETVGRKVDFNSTTDIVNTLAGVVVEAPPKKEVQAITALTKKRVLDAKAKADTWCKVMGESPLGLI